MMTDKYYQLVGLAQESPADAQKEMKELAKQYTDKDLAELWNTSIGKVRDLRYTLGISKTTGGNIKDVKDPDTLEISFGENKTTSLSQKDTFDLKISGVFTSTQILAYLEVLEEAAMSGSDYFYFTVMLKERGGVKK